MQPTIISICEMKMFIDVVNLQSICSLSYNTEERDELKFKLIWNHFYFDLRSTALELPVLTIMCKQSDIVYIKHFF